VKESLERAPDAGFLLHNPISLRQPYGFNHRHQFTRILEFIESTKAVLSRPRSRSGFSLTFLHFLRTVGQALA
jgi:hypothetical protein